MGSVNYKVVVDAHKAVYDTLAQEYESLVSSRFKGNYDRIQLFSQFIPKGATVLDIGCGVGMDILHFTNLGYIASGIDVSHEMVEFAKKRNRSCEVIEGDFLLYDFGQRKWEAIFTRAFLHLFPKDTAHDILKKIYNSLQPNGIALFSVSSSNNPTEGWEAKGDYKTPGLRYKKTWALDELRASLQAAGFELIEINGIIDRINKPRIIAIAKRPKL